MDENDYELNWSASITQRQKYLLMMKPLLNLNKNLIRDEKKNFLGNHYDSLAIGLKIVEIIMDNTSIVNLTAIKGLNREDIFQNIKPYLSRIDVKKNKIISENLQRFLINKIIDTMISQGREQYRIDFIDYNKDDYEWQSKFYQLLYLDTTPDDEMHIMVSSEMINIFTNLLEMKIEDKQRAIQYLLQEQIKRGDFENAVITAETNFNITIAFMRNIEDIIFKTKRKYQSIEWISNYPSKLSEAMDHIVECITKQSKMQTELLRQFSDTIEIESESYLHFKNLIRKLKKSNSVLLPLQNMISKAQHCIEESTEYIFGIEKKIGMNLESDFFPLLLMLPLSKLDEHLISTCKFFSSPIFPKILNLSNVTNLLIKQHERNRKRAIKNKGIKRNPRVIDRDTLNLDIETKFSPQRRKEIINKIINCILNRNNQILLSELLKDLRKIECNINDLHYTVIFILGNFAIDSKFEDRYTKRHINVELTSKKFEDLNYIGRDFTISIKEDSKIREKSA